MTLQQIEQILRDGFRGDRYRHSIGVAETARTFAEQHGYPAGKAYLAGLLHDCAKIHTPSDILSLAVSMGLSPSDAQREMPEVKLHAEVGAFLARRDFGVEDEEILRAISRHQSGAEDMSLLDSIVWLADRCEPGRSSPAAERMRALAPFSLEDALFCGLCDTITRVVAEGWYLSPGTTAFYNQMLLQHKN